MTKSLEHSNTTLQASLGYERLLTEKFETKLARFERLGMQLFSVANCFLSFGHVTGRSGGGAHTITEMEAVFSDSLPLTDEYVVIPDLCVHPELHKHRYVEDEPFIRFYASYPVHGENGRLVACLRLLDYSPRQPDESMHLLLQDLASTVEHDLALAAMFQNQLVLVKQNRTLKREAMIDPLLGTWNRGAIARSLTLELERCTKAAKPLSLLFLQPDQINEMRAMHGMLATDQVLIRMVSRVRSCIRPFDALGRFGNDLLLVVLPGASHLVVTAVAERIRLAILMNPERFDDMEAELTVSIGSVSTDLFPEADPEILLGLAEKALLSARNAGNNKVVQANPAQPDIQI